MVHFLSLKEAARQVIPEGGLLPPPPYALWENQAPDLHLIQESGGHLFARCSLWWSQVPSLPKEALGVLGHFSAINRSSAMEILAAAADCLREKKCTLMVGPMDGNTWRSYRFVTWPGTEPHFFLEPAHPAEYPGWFSEFGFSPLAEYTSAISDQLEIALRGRDRYRQSLLEQEISIRPLEMDHFSGELDRIYTISESSFQSNFLYTPIPREEFRVQYRAVEARVDSRFVLIAEKNHQPIGYVFAIPDWLSPDPLSTLIVKTLAVLPGWNGMGIGGALLAEVQARAHECGFTRAIHALMHETNRSRSLSNKYAKEMRRYTLFSKRL